jgi:PAS domain S-box-containing protein
LLKPSAPEASDTTEGQALFVGEEALVLLTAALPVPLLISRADGDGAILFSNQAAAKLAQLHPRELLGRRAPDFYVCSEDRERLLCALRRDGEVADCEIRLRTGQGTEFWASLSVRLFQHAGGPLLITALRNIDDQRNSRDKITGLLRQIERQKAELEHRVHERTRELSEARDAAARARQQLVDAIEGISEGFVLYDAEDRLVLCNSKYRDDFSFSPELIRPGRLFEEIVREGTARGQLPDGYDAETWIRERLNRHGSSDKPTVVRRKDGRWVRMTEYRTSEGGIVGLRADITELVRRQEALEENRRLLRAVIDAVPAVINVKDRDSRYVLMNRFQGEVYGVAPESALGLTSIDLVGESYGAASHQFDRQVIESGAALPFTERDFVDVRGRPHTWLTAKMPLKDDRGSVTNVVTVALDITDLKATERARTNLSRYFAPNMVEMLAGSDEPFGPARAQNIAVLFVDLVGFTRICAEEPPEIVFTLLREFQKRMAACLFDCAGTLDKYMGDSLMATFGTPETGADDATRALRCARAMLREMAAWNVERREAGSDPILAAVGLHFGPALLGNVGDARRLEFAVIGDTVNVANRLEKLARPLDVGIVVGEELVERVRRESGPDALELEGLTRAGSQVIRGRSAPIAVWTLPRA